MSSLTPLFLTVVRRDLSSLGICLFRVDFCPLPKKKKKLHSMPCSTNFFINVITGLVGDTEAHYKASKK